MQEFAPKKIGASEFEGEDETFYDYEVPNAKTGKLLGVMTLRYVKQQVIDKYRELRNGSNDGRRKGDVAKAREFLFQKTYVRFVFVDEDGKPDPTKEIDLGDCKTDLEFFIKKTTKVVDAVMIQYLAQVFPDVDPKKSQTPLD